jgi:hypothetical protein
MGQAVEQVGDSPFITGTRLAVEKKQVGDSLQSLNDMGQAVEQVSDSLFITGTRLAVEENDESFLAPA